MSLKPWWLDCAGVEWTCLLRRKLDFIPLPTKIIWRWPSDKGALSSRKMRIFCVCMQPVPTIVG